MPINIRLMEDWRIKSDKHQYMLVKESAGSEETVGYYVSLDSCVQAFLDKKIKGFSATSINSLLSSIKSLSKACEEVLKPLQLKVVHLSEVNKGEKEDGDINAV